MRNRGAEVRRRLRDGSRAARDPVGIEAKAQSDRTVAVSRSTRTGVLSADQHGGGHRTAHVMQGPAGRINGDLRLLFARVRTLRALQLPGDSSTAERQGPASTGTKHLSGCCTSCYTWPKGATAPTARRDPGRSLGMDRVTGVAPVMLFVPVGVTPGAAFGTATIAIDASPCGGSPFPRRAPVVSGARVIR